MVQSDEDRSIWRDHFWPSAFFWYPDVKAFWMLKFAKSWTKSRERPRDFMFFFFKIVSNLQKLRKYFSEMRMWDTTHFAASDVDKSTLPDFFRSCVSRFWRFLKLIDQILLKYSKSFAIKTKTKFFDSRTIDNTLNRLPISCWNHQHLSTATADPS